MHKPIDSAKPITALKSFHYPQYMIFFDTEALIGKLQSIKNKISERHNFRIGVAIYVQVDKKINVLNREVFYYSTPKEFWDYVKYKNISNTTLYIYAHNAKYDTLNVDVIHYLSDYLNYDVPFPTINNAFIITAKKGNKRIKIVDTFNYVKTSVDSMGEKMGIPKLNLDEYRTIKKHVHKKAEIDFNSIPDDILFKYCERDVEVIEKWKISQLKLLHVNHLGSDKFTTASIAMDIYRHSFIENGKEIYYHKNDDLLKLERAAYRGGIVECFKLGKLPKQNYYLLDINSMYVNVMSKFKLPNYPILYIDNPTLPDLLNSVDNYYIIADVLLCVENNYGQYGVKDGTRLIFPTGEYRVTLHQAELELAIKENIITQVFKYAVYNSEYCLKSYADYFYKMKSEATNKVDSDNFKLYGNGFYGKLGMRKYITEKANLDESLASEEDYILYQLEVDKQLKLSAATQIKIKLNVSNKPDYIPTLDGGEYIKWGDIYVRTSTDDFIHVPRTNIALAGAVTAYARISLSTYLKIAEYENVFYSDTDSIMVNQIGYNNLANYLDDKELGKLKCELQFNSGIIKAPKNYTFSIKTKHNINHSNNIIHYFSHHTKIKKNIKTILNVKLNKRSINLIRRDRSKGIPSGAINNNGIMEFMRFTTFKEYLKTGGELKGRVKQTRKLSLNYNKGNKFNKDQFGNTEPYRMEYTYNKDTDKWVNRITNKAEVKQQTK